MRDLDKVLTSEMTTEEWNEFMKRGIAQWRKDLVTECGMDKDDPDLDLIAEVKWDQWSAAEGFTMRDEMIHMARRKEE